jgi:uncharacterized cupin superfamily protein
VAVPEAQLEETEHGLVPVSEGWFVVNARAARWYRTGDARISNFSGDTRFEQLGVGIAVLGPGEPMACYHREWDQEGFLVLRGSGTLVVEGEERPLRQWDYFHCPPEVAHVVVGGPIVVLAVGGRKVRRVEYVADPVAARYGAAPKRTTTEPREAYEGWERPTHTRYDGWLD